MTQDETIKQACRYFFQAHSGLRHIETEEDLYWYVKARFDLDRPKGENMEEPTINRILRAMAWQRAKGEMNSMIQTYFNNTHKWQEFREVSQNFINQVEAAGLEK